MNNIMTDEENIKINELFEANQTLQSEIDQLRKEYDGIADRLLGLMVVCGKLRKLLNENNINHDY